MDTQSADENAGNSDAGMDTQSAGEKRSRDHCDEETAVSESCVPPDGPVKKKNSPADLASSYATMTGSLTSLEWLGGDGSPGAMSKIVETDPLFYSSSPGRVVSGMMPLR